MTDASPRRRGRSLSLFFLLDRIHKNSKRREDSPPIFSNNQLKAQSTPILTNWAPIRPSRPVGTATPNSRHLGWCDVFDCQSAAILFFYFRFDSQTAFSRKISTIIAHKPTYTTNSFCIPNDLRFCMKVGKFNKRKNQMETKPINLSFKAIYLIANQGRSQTTKETCNR